MLTNGKFSKVRVTRSWSQGLRDRVEAEQARSVMQISVQQQVSGYGEFLSKVQYVKLLA